MNGAEDMIVDHDMVVTQVFGRLGKRLDRPRIPAKLNLRINHTSFHRPLCLSRCEVLRQTGPFGSGPESAARTIADYSARDDDRELQMEQTIVGRPARKPQPAVWRPAAARPVFGTGRSQDRTAAGARFAPYGGHFPSKPKRLSRVDSGRSPGPAHF